MSTLDAWDEQLAEVGADLVRRRRETDRGA